MRFIFCFFALLILTSCVAEKSNISPITSTMSKESKGSDAADLTDAFSINIKKNINAAEITNLVGSFPRFSNSRLNAEVSVLKYSLQNYLYAIDVDNVDGKKKSLKKVRKAYQDIQKLRKFLNYNDNEVINRYLVRIKTNIDVIENTLGSKKI